MKRFIALITALSVLVCLTACGKKEEPDTTEKEYILPSTVVESDVSLPYTSADVFEPYEAKSDLNRDLIYLVYDSLFYPTADGKGKAVLAAEGEINGTTVSVKLKQGVKFSDGTLFTAQSVKSSLEKARASVYFSSLVSNITDITAIDNYTVEFTLAKADPQALNTLSFPIVNGADKTSRGTGAYCVKYTDDGAPFLEAVKSHANYKSLKNKQIALYDMAGVTSPVYPFKANKISAFKNDLSGGEYTNLSSNTVSVPTYRFVYAGINSKWAGSLTSIDWVRQAINIGIDRAEITAGSFLGQGTAVVTPFKNEFYQLEGITTLASVNGETERAIAILERNGYDKVNADGVRTNGANSLWVSILVCGENQYKVDAANSLEKSLKRLGFGVTMNVAETAESFKAILDEGYFGIYIGETILSPNSDLSEFFTKSGSLNYGIDEKMFDSYAEYRTETGSLKPFIEEFSTNVPIIPLFYRNAVVAVNPNLTNVAAGDYDLYSQAGLWQMAEN